MKRFPFVLFCALSLPLQFAIADDHDYPPDDNTVQLNLDSDVTDGGTITIAPGILFTASGGTVILSTSPGTNWIINNQGDISANEIAILQQNNTSLTLNNSNNGTISSAESRGLFADSVQTLTINNTSGGIIEGDLAAVVYYPGIDTMPVNITNTGPGSIIRATGTSDALHCGLDIEAFNEATHAKTYNITNSNGALIEAGTDAIYFFCNDSDQTVNITNTGPGSTIRSTVNNNGILFQSSDIDGNTYNVTNSDQALISGIDFGVYFFSESQTNSTQTVMNQSGGIIEGLNDGVRFNSTPNLPGTSTLTITNTGQGSIIRTAATTGNAATNSGIQIENNGNDTVVINNEDNAKIEGLSEGISCFENGDGGSISINNTATIKGKAGPAINFDAYTLSTTPRTPPSGEFNLNLNTNSQLKYSGHYVVMGSSLSLKDSLNLMGTGTQTGSFSNFEYLNMGGSEWTLGGTPDTLLQFDLISGNAGTLNLSGRFSPGLQTMTPPAGAVAGTVKISDSNIWINDAKAAGPFSDGQKFKFLRTADLYVDGVPVPAPGADFECDPNLEGPCLGFSSIANQFNEGHKFILCQQSGSVDLLLEAKESTFYEFIAPYLRTSNQDAIARYLSDLDLSLEPGLASDFGRLNNASPWTVAETLSQMDPSRLADISLIALYLGDVLNNNTTTHQRTLRNNNPPPRDNSLWVQPFGDFNSRKNKGQFAGFDSRTYGFTLGIDKFICTPRFSFGGVMGYANTSLDWKNNLGNAEVDSLLYGIYASYKNLDKCHNGYYIDAVLQGSNQSISARRNIPNLGLTATNTHSDWGFGARLGAGYNWTLWGCLIGPYIYTDYLLATSESFTETGAGPLNNLRVSIPDQDLVRIEHGTSVSKSFKLTDCISLSPLVKLSTVHKLAPSKNKLPAQAVSVPGLRVQSFRKHITQFSPATSLTMIWKDHTFLTAYYEGEYGDSHYSTEVGLRASVRF